MKNPSVGDLNNLYSEFVKNSSTASLNKNSKAIFSLFKLLSLPIISEVSK